MPIAVVGLNHRTAPIEVRERFAISEGEAPRALERLVSRGVSEAVMLSTCNRTEVYLASSNIDEAETEARRLLIERSPVDFVPGDGLLYTYRERRAAEHLFRVASGLDSMVLGEPQIQGQVKDAYGLARSIITPHGPVVGSTMNRLFQSAFSVGGRVRSETELGTGAASIPSAAVDLAKKIFGSLNGRRALVLGAGEMSEVTLECLRDEGIQSWIIANRTYDRARELAEKCGGQVVHWDRLAESLRSVDIVVASTAAPHPVLSRDEFRRAMPNGAPRPICIIDIAIPRDVQPDVAEETNVFLYNIDDLEQIVDDNLGRRRDEKPKAEAIVHEAADGFIDWYNSLKVVPTIRELRKRGEELRRAELERALNRLSHLGEEDRKAVDVLTRQLLNKLLHAPTVRLREAGTNGRVNSVLDTVRYLFELDGSADTDEAKEDLPPGTLSISSHLDPEEHSGARSGTQK